MIGYKLVREDGGSLSDKHPRFMYDLEPGDWRKVPGNGAYVAEPGGRIWAGGSGPVLLRLESPDDESDVCKSLVRGVRCRRTIRTLARLTWADVPNLFVEFAWACPYDALDHARVELTQFPDLFAKSAWAEPWDALKNAHAELAQFPDLFAKCARAHPWAALEYARAELSRFPDLLAECERACEKLGINLASASRWTD